MRELITSAAEHQARYQLQTQELLGDVDRLSRNADTTQTFVKQQVDQNRQLMQLSRQLQVRPAAAHSATVRCPAARVWIFSWTVEWPLLEAPVGEGVCLRFCAPPAAAARGRDLRQ